MQPPQSTEVLAAALRNGADLRIAIEHEGIEGQVPSPA